MPERKGKRKKINEKKMGVDEGYIFFNNSSLPSSVTNRNMDDASNVR